MLKLVGAILSRKENTILSKLAYFGSFCQQLFSHNKDDDEEHKCPSWREGPCRYLKCLLEREKESREYDAAGYCDDCEENKNDCECDQDQELQSKL